MHAASPTQLREKRSERILCLLWGYGAERAFAEAGRVPKTECLSVRDPIVTFRPESHTTNVVRCGSAFYASYEVDQGTFPDSGFSYNDDVTN